MKNKPPVTHQTHMTKNIRTQIEIILLALLALVRESGGTDEHVTLPPDPNASPGPATLAPTPEPQPEQDKRHRRTKEQIAADNAAAEAAAKAAQTTKKEDDESNEVAEEKAAKEEPVTGGKTYEELQAIIAPVVRGNKEKNIAPQGPAVKALIQKYVGSPDGVLTQLATMPQHHAAFIADVEALTY